MTTNYDCIVIGGGITGSAVSYELAKQGLKVLLLEKDITPHNATYYSYGGLAYWSGITLLTRQLCQEGIDIHRQLSAELEADTEFRELDLVLTIDAEQDPQAIAQSYQQFAIPPQLLSIEEACQLEPLLNPKAISGVLKLPHGHIHTQKTNNAYQQKFRRLGGHLEIAKVVNLLRNGNQIEGVITPTHTYYAANTIICAGGLSRELLKQVAIKVKLYFTHAQVIATPPLDIQMQTIVMPAIQNRFNLEASATQAEWEQPSTELIAGILDPGAIQFLDKSFYIGQISQIVTDPHTKIDTVGGEIAMRQAIGKVLPVLENVPGTCHHCLVSFTHNALPLVGAINNYTGVYLFSGFTSPLVFAPPLARRFASWLVEQNDEIIAQLSPVI